MYYFNIYVNNIVIKETNNIIMNLGLEYWAKKQNIWNLKETLAEDIEAYLCKLL